MRPTALISADLQALLDLVAAAIAVAGSGRCTADPVSRAAGCPFNLLAGGPLCIFREKLRCDAKDEEYESAVLNWIYGYHGLESLGSALDATLSSLWQEMRETGEFPVGAGVDAPRAWAFVIARGHDKSSHTQTTVMCCRELPLTLEAIRRHPGVDIKDLPPLPPSQRT